MAKEDYRVAPTWLHKGGASELFATQEEVDKAWDSGWSDKKEPVDPELLNYSAFAIKIKGKKRALKVCDSVEECQVWIYENLSEEKQGKAYIEGRA